METIKFQKGSRVDRVLEYAKKDDSEIRDQLAVELNRIWDEFNEFTDEYDQTIDAFFHNCGWIFGVEQMLLVSGLEKESVRFITDRLKQINIKRCREAADNNLEEKQNDNR